MITAEQMEIDNFKLECPICYYVFGQLHFQVYQCGHFICVDCLGKALRRECSICRIAVVALRRLEDILPIPVSSPDKFEAAQN
jgi:hypothetical protein